MSLPSDRAYELEYKIIGKGRRNILGEREKEIAYYQNVLFSADLDTIVEFLKARALSLKELQGRAEKLRMLEFLEF